MYIFSIFLQKYREIWLLALAVRRSRTENREPRTENPEPRTQNREPRTQNREPRTENSGPPPPCGGEGGGGRRLFGQSFTRGIVTFATADNDNMTVFEYLIYLVLGHWHKLYGVGQRAVVSVR